MHWLMQRIGVNLEYFKSILFNYALQQRTISPTNSKDGMLFIPKTIHFIWLGSILPTQYQANIKTWLELNPDYKFKLWIDSGALPLESTKQDVAYMQQFCKQNKIQLCDVATLPSFKSFIQAPFYNDWLNGFDQTFAFAADQLRLKILYDYGGIYSDIDTVCVEPIGTLHNKLGLFAWGNSKYISDNCFIAAVKQHPLILSCSEEMQLYYRQLMLFTLSRDAILVRKNIPGIDKNASSMPAGYYRIDEKYWEDWAYDNLRFKKPLNDSRRSGCFSAPVTFSLMNRELRDTYGDAGLQECVFYENTKVKHTRDNSWATYQNHATRKKGIELYKHEPERIRLTLELAKQRAKASILPRCCNVQ